MAQQDILRLDEDYIHKYGFYDTIEPVFETGKGLSRRVVEEISYQKGEPKWMRDFRLQAYEIFLSKPMPRWGPDLSALDFDSIVYYIKPTERQGRSWDEVPEDIKRTFDRLGIPEWERKFLAGVGAQYDSEVIYHNLAKQWEEKGVIFVDTDTAVREYPDLVREYFGTVIPPHDNKFAALNSAVWSGGSFVYVPAGVHVEIPLQAYFRINAKNAGQFERTLIIAEEGAFVHYVEGCLPAGEQVCTESGWVNIESVKPGDFVIGSHGRKVRVRAVMTRPYRGEIIQIRPVSFHNAFQLTPEHPVLCVRREKAQSSARPRHPHWKRMVETPRLIEASPEYVPAGELREGDFLVFPKIQPAETETSFSIEQIRLLGYYLAEGSAYVHKRLNMPMVTFTVVEHEKEVVEDIVRLLAHLTGKRAYVVPQSKRHVVNITVYSRELMEFCLEHAGKGSATKRLSEAVMRLPTESLRPLIEAYFAGDGNTCWKGKSEMRRISTASLTLARQIQMLLARMGIYACIQHRAGGEDTVLGRRIRRRDQYMVVWTHNRRTGEVRDAGDYFLVPIKQIERKEYDGFVFNLDVEEPHSYLVRGFATHNCTAPVYAESALHSAVVEIIVKPGARVRYTTIQNWSRDVYNLVTKRAVAYRDAVMEWVDGNIGSRVTMKYPSVYLMEPGARGEILSVAFAGDGQHQDTGGKVIHAAPFTSSRITSKSISKGTGRASYRGLVQVLEGAHHSKCNVECDALLLDEHAKTDTYPYIEINEKEVTIGHEARVSKVSEEQLFYLQSRGLKKDEALTLIISGFIEPLAKQLPMEYAVELNRLIELEMEGSVG